MEPLVTSVCYYCCVFVACEALRRLCWSLLPSSAASFATDAIGTLQICSCVYENALVVKHFGVGGFFVAVVSLVVAHSFLNRGAQVLPTAALEDALLRGRWGASMKSFAAQLLGGYGAFRLAKGVWWFHLSHDHASHYADFPCTLTWKVPVLVMCAYEALGCFVIRSVVGRTEPRYRRYVAAVVQASALSLELAFLGPAGLNPIIAGSRLVGCRGMGLGTHVAVYWACPSLGWLAAAKLHDASSAAPQKPAKQSAAKNTKKD